MIIRPFEERDFPSLKNIHEKFYRDEFEAQELFRNALALYVVEESDKVITIGGVRAIAESVCMTDKEAS